ncbi:hypothetical protein HDU83_004438 [Entophlyctis luteolus]|nr:hypothetical protein HDU83_004438 [Entophlyctis luteolus]
MAASFWESSQRRHWLFPAPRLLALARASAPAAVSAVERSYILMYYTSGEFLRRVKSPLTPLSQTEVMAHIAKLLKLRQQVLATAIVFLRRHCLKTKLAIAAPSLPVTAVTCVYLAAKVEESPVHIKSVVQAVSTLHIAAPGSALSHPPPAQAVIDAVRISESEFYLLESLSFHLIVFHPYNSLTAYVETLPLPKETSTVFFQNAWMVVNDVYRSDLILMYPPHMLALGVIYVTAGMQEEAIKASSMDFGKWFADVNVSLDEVHITQFNALHGIALACLGLSLFGSSYIVARTVQKRKFKTIGERFPLYLAGLNIWWSISHFTDHLVSLILGRPPGKEFCRVFGNILEVFLLGELTLVNITALSIFATVYLQWPMEYGAYDWMIWIAVFGLPACYIIIGSESWEILVPKTRRKKRTQLMQFSTDSFDVFGPDVWFCFIDTTSEAGIVAWWLTAIPALMCIIIPTIWYEDFQPHAAQRKLIEHERIVRSAMSDGMQSKENTHNQTTARDGGGNKPNYSAPVRKLVGMYTARRICPK